MNSFSIDSITCSGAFHSLVFVCARTATWIICKACHLSAACKGCRVLWTFTPSFLYTHVTGYFQPRSFILCADSSTWLAVPFHYRLFFPCLIEQGFASPAFSLLYIRSWLSAPFPSLLVSELQRAHAGPFLPVTHVSVALFIWSPPSLVSLRLWNLHGHSWKFTDCSYSDSSDIPCWVPLTSVFAPPSIVPEYRSREVSLREHVWMCVCLWPYMHLCFLCWHFLVIKM